MIRQAFLLSALLALLSPVANALEEPAFELLETIGEVELRRYAPTIEARTPLVSNRETGGGFQRLAGYIFGGNDSGEKIAMTAPVAETLSGSESVMAFTMPSSYDISSLPEPNDPNVSLHRTPERLVAAVEFGGWATSGKVKRYREQLISTLADSNISLAGPPTLHQFNPPWTPPFLRRNEIVVEVTLN